MTVVMNDKRPWGNFEVIHVQRKDAEEGDVVVKKITIDPNKRLSYQSHEKRNEHWFITQGEGTVVIDDKEYEVVSGDSIDVPLGVKHRIGNASDVNVLTFIEISTGVFDENDIKRFDDDFGRAHI